MTFTSHFSSAVLKAWGYSYCLGDTVNKLRNRTIFLQLLSLPNLNMLIEMRGNNYNNAWCIVDTQKLFVGPSFYKG